MKKLFTIDDFMIAVVAALGYGLGYSIPMQFGCSMFICLAVCLVLGIGLEEIIGKIVFSKAVQKSRKNRIMAFAAILLTFLAAQYISIRWMGVSLMEYIHEEFMFVVGLSILGLIVNLIIRGYHVRKIRRLYGDGREGYVFDLKDKDIKETNRQNQPIHGTYDADLAVKTRTGIYIGERYKKTICYLGIPYAKPPVGNLRWKAPKPLPPSDTVFEAKNFGASAIQVDHKGAILKNHRQSEDCLYVNVCVGNEKTETKKTVLVLFHHGDFTYGGSADPLLYGDNYVREHPDIVFVSFNYRLGIFGFIDFSEIPGGKDYPDALNLGLLDQIAALRWIKENIAAFGGDPERITVLGFESGATSICLLAASPEARGLFTKAFVFNGNLGTVYDSPEGSKALAKDLLKETNTATMEELLRLDADTLKDAAAKLWQDMCAPTCDGTLIPTDVCRAYQESAANGIEFIIGIPSNESQVFRSFIGEESYEKLVKIGTDGIQSAIDGSLADEVQEFIESQTALSSELEAKSKLIDQWIAIHSYRSAMKLSESGNKVHVMYWDEKALIEKLGSGTVDAAAALLGNNDALQIYGGVVDKDLSEILQGFLQKFINGDALTLYHNEIHGVDAISWMAFPYALIVSDKKILCDKIEGRLKEIKGVFEFMINQM
jgi:para-nitrobenzyl esterase